MEIVTTPIVMQTAAATVFSVKNCTSKVCSVSSETQQPPRYRVWLAAADTMVGRHFILVIQGLVLLVRRPMNFASESAIDSAAKLSA